MLKTIQRFHVALFLLLIVNSCNDFKYLNERSKLMFKNNDNLFRGLDFDIGHQQVKSKETALLRTEFEDHLGYILHADSLHEGEFIELEYFFNKDDQLDVILAFYNMQHKKDIQPLINNLKLFLEKKYGRANQDELGWYNWEFEDKSGIPGTIEIKLIGETEEGYLGVELEMLKYYGYEERL